MSLLVSHWMNCSTPLFFDKDIIAISTQ